MCLGLHIHSISFRPYKKSLEGGIIVHFADEKTEAQTINNVQVQHKRRLARLEVLFSLVSLGPLASRFPITPESMVS